MNIERANEIYARELGVAIHDDGYVEHSPCEEGTTFTYMEWTIEDARCRELVREKFDINTARKFNSFRGYYWLAHREIGEPFGKGEGKSIAEAEIACLLQIAERLEE